MSVFLNLVGNNIRILRKARGLTQEELAEKAELQYSYIGGIERGERNISLLTLEKITKSLNISPASLFDFNNIEVENDKTYILEAHRNVIQSLDINEIKTVHNITKEIITLLDKKNS